MALPSLFLVYQMPETSRLSYHGYDYDDEVAETNLDLKEHLLW